MEYVRKGENKMYQKVTDYATKEKYYIPQVLVNGEVKSLRKNFGRAREAMNYSLRAQAKIS